MSTPSTAPVASDRRGGVTVFLIVAFAVTWAIWLPLLIQAQTSGLEQLSWTFLLASVGPLCGAVSAALWQGGLSGLATWARRTFSVRFRWVWWLAGIGMPVGYFAIAWVTVFVTTGAWPEAAEFGVTEKLPGFPWPMVALVWMLTFGLGEEAGWRGWLLPALMRRMPAFWSASLVGGVWVIWHIPAFFFNPTYMAMGWAVLGWVFALVCGSYLLAWMAIGARWSIVPVLLWHAGFDLLTGADQSAGVIASTISAIVMVQGIVCGWLLWRRRRTRAAAPASTASSSG